MKRSLILVLALAAISMFVMSEDCENLSAESSGTDYGHYYYDQMTELQKQIYDGIDSMTIENPKFSMGDNSLTMEDLQAIVNESETVFALYKLENPDKYWIGASIEIYTERYLGQGFNCTFELQSLMTEYGTKNSEVEANLAKIETVINGYSGGIDMTSVFTKVQSIHSIVIGLLEYDETSSETMVSRNIATAFLGGSFNDPASVVCEGYAKTFKAICDVYGVPCIIVTGKGVSSTGPEDHMWNQVLIDGKWYLVDCTWDDQSENMYSDFMLVGSGSVPEHFNKISIRDSHQTDEMYSSFNVTLSDSSFGRPSYEIRLKAYGNDLALLYYNAGESIRVPYSPAMHSDTSSAYTFDGWDINGTAATELPVATGDRTYVAVFSSDQITCGSCGDNVTYRYDAGTCAMVISGKGELEYTSAGSPWNSYKTSIKSVIVNDAVTSISANAFSGCTSLVSITISKSVVSLGDNAFSGTFYGADGKTVLKMSAYQLAGSTFKKSGDGFVRQENAIYFDSGGGTYVDRIFVMSDSKISAPADPTKTGYVFRHWTQDGNSAYDFPETMPATDLYLKAVWVIDEFTVTYKVDGLQMASLKHILRVRRSPSVTDTQRRDTLSPVGKAPMSS